MNIFVNDYNDLCHPDVWEALSGLHRESNRGYCFDDHCKRAAELIGEKTGKDPDVYFLPGGTITNILALTHCLMPYEAIVTPDTGHVVAHEVGAPEAFGHKLIPVPNLEGKLTPETVEKALEGYGPFYNVLPKILYLSNTTELGTVYSKEELKALYDFAKERGLYLYLDGARLASAMAAANLTWTDFSEVCDVFSIGGTKDGGLFGEALVFFEKELSKNFHFYMKQHGVLMAKGFLIGAQFEVLLKGEPGEELYVKNGRLANEAAKFLAEKWAEIGEEFYAPFASNQVFLIVRRDLLIPLARTNFFEEDAIVDDTRQAIRLVTTYRTKKEEILGFIEDYRRLRGE